MIIQDALSHLYFLCHQRNSVEDVDAFQTLRAAVLAQQTNNTTRDEICANALESNVVCDYCQRTVGAKVACSFSMHDFSCFRGRKLSPVA